MTPASLTSRRTVLTLGVSAFVVATLPRALSRRSRTVVRRTLPGMSTIADVAVVSDGDDRRARAAVDAAVEALLRVEAGMTRFRADSDVGRANLSAGRGPVPVSEETALVVEEALLWAQASDGAFDPCLARVSDAWDVTRRREPPPAEAFRRFAARSLWRSVDVDRAAGVVRIGDPDAALDLGGIAKGHAVDRAAEAIRALDLRDALVNLGGEVFALGRSPEGDPWRVGIRDPDDASRIVDTVEASDVAIATSGDYVQYFDFAGRRYHHILDSATGEPRRAREHGVTVLAPTGTAADAAATAVYGMSPDRAARLLAARCPGARVVRTT